MGLYPSDRLLLLTCSSVWAWDYIPQTDFSYWHVPLLEHGIISLRSTSLIDMFFFFSMGLYPSDRLLLLTCSSFWAWNYIPQTDFSYWYVLLFEHGIISLRPTSLIDMFFFLSMGLHPSDRLLLLTCSSFWAWDYIPQIDFSYLACSSFWAWDYIPQTHFSYWHVPLFEHGIISLRSTSLIWPVLLF